jgi:hypothetical protein
VGERDVYVAILTALDAVEAVDRTGHARTRREVIARLAPGGVNRDLLTALVKDIAAASPDQSGQSPTEGQLDDGRVEVGDAHQAGAGRG